MATKKQKESLLQSILDWQEERNLENWTADQLRGELGIVIDENFTMNDLFANEDGIFHITSEEGQVEVIFEKGGTFGGYTLALLDGGVYQITRKT